MKPAKKPGRRAKLPLTVVSKQEHEALRVSFAEHEQLWLPMRDLIQNTRISVDALMYDAGRALVEQLLMVSAREVAGDKHAGRAAGDGRWHGSQPSRIVWTNASCGFSGPACGTGAARKCRFPPTRSWQ